MQQAAPKKQRCIWVDVVKGFAILCMVYAHCVYLGQGKIYADTNGWYDDIISLAIYSFHMPVLMMISGYFFKHTADKLHGMKMLLNRIQCLLVPAFVFCLASMLLEWKPITLLPYQYSRSLWFLWALFVASFYTIALRKLPILAFSICLLLPLIPDNYDYFWTHLWKFMLPYFLAGFYWNEYHGWDRLGTLLSRFRWLVLALLGGGWLWLMTYYRKESLIYYSGIYLFNGYSLQWQIDLFRYAVGFVGSLFFIWVAFMFFSKPSVPANMLGKLGRSSIWIYFLTSLLNIILAKVTASFTPMPLIPILETAIMLALCFITEPLIRKIPYLGKWILGGR